MEFFQGFTVTWAVDGPVADLTEQAVRAGWGFIGQVPPAVEQFNAVHRGDGLRQQWLFNQVKGVTDAAGLTLTAENTDTLQAAIAHQLSPIAASAAPKSVTSASGNHADQDGHTHALDNTGVTAGIYGASNRVGRFQVDQKGRIVDAVQADINLPDLAGILPVNKGGTGADDGAGARSNLGMDAFLYAAQHVMGDVGHFEFLSNDDQARLIIQWGVVGVPGDSARNFNFPRAFPNACLAGVACLGGSFSPTADAGCAIYNLSATGATIMVGTAVETATRWIAIGY
ncbi:gp53-like domain-containing protein [Stenotrophomonas maltophilia]|uniref:gp53-like domain-containing protein n=1 Tax=Stenotrophomonas maltophilia TaxID=40324 RepID=UPI00201CCF11|nr:hypothetical protein [Stenotrophomonas maltophilia]UQY97313.1 hypothetical protein LZ605_08120 [Stenotrophomonas maltophilia]